MKNKFKIEFLRTAVGILIALVILSVVVFLVSDEPLIALKELFLGPVSSMRNFSSVVEKWIPLMFTGLAISLIFSSDNFNLASEGAFYTGGLVAMILSFTIDVHSIVFWVILLIVSGIVGGIIVVIPGYLKNKANANEIVSSLMINEIMFLLGTYILINYFVPVGAKSVSTALFPDKYRLPILITNTTIHFGIVIAIISFGITYVLMKKTRFGYKVQITGKNPKFANLVGINVGFIGLISQFIGGILSGIGGAVHTLGVFKWFTSNKLPGYGWDGIIVAVLARNNPIFVPLSAFFIAYLKAGAVIMGRKSDVSYEVIIVMQAVIIMMIIAKKLISKYEFKLLLKEMNKKEGVQHE